MTRKIRELCKRIDSAASKWRPYVQGEQKLSVALVRLDNGQSLGSRVLTADECCRLAHDEMDPLVILATE